MNRHVKRNRAFTLIEILIVVVILGILAAIVIPQFSDASTDAAESSVKSTLQAVRAQLELYNFRNNGYPSSVDALWDDANAEHDGNDYLQSAPVAPAGYAFGYTAGTGAFYETTNTTW
ncbi:MAG: prepilin-type N-terminal cleavage/methylation domain-containing protein [Phycisphaerales bacterium]|nr:prepilin-type N-terminal cleavage/methylation domain-containing protein [Phycisphaerales bacterium]